MGRRRLSMVAGSAILVTATLALSGTATASHGGDDGPAADDSTRSSLVQRAGSGDDRASDRARREIRRAGRCSASSRWKFKVKTEDNGRLEIEFEVDQNRNRQRWGVTLKQNGRNILRRAYRTRPPSGSFEARKITRDRRGRDRLVATARNPRSGERCVARVTF